jgi:phage shock protein C
MNQRIDQVTPTGQAPGPDRTGWPPPPMPPIPPHGERPLRRSRTDKVVAGVCGGLGRQLDVDPVLLRIAFVVLALADGVGILLYNVAAIVIPQEPPGEPAVPARPSDPALGRMLVGLVLVALGALLLVDRVVPFADRIFWPLIVVAIGVAIVLKGVRR